MRAVRTTPLRLSWRVMGKARTLQVMFCSSGFGQVEQAAASAVDVGLAGERDGLNDLAPVAHERGHLGGRTAAGKPVAGLAEVFGGGVVAVEPDAAVVEDLDEDVGTDGQRDAGVEEVAGVDDDGSAAAFGFEGAERGEQVFDGAVAFEQVHVFGAAEETLERGGEDDDGDVGTAAAQQAGDFGAELPGAEMVVEDSDVDVVEELGCLFDGRGGNAVVAVLTEDGRAEKEIVGVVVEQQDANARLDVSDMELSLLRVSVQIVHQLRFLDAGSLCQLSYPGDVYFESTLRLRKSSGRRLKSATERSHWRLSMAG